MEREIEIGGERIRLDLRQDGERILVQIGGTAHEVRYVPLPDGRCLCLVDGRTVEWDKGGSNGTRRVVSGTVVRHLKVSDPRKRHAGSAAAASGRADILAPMPGKVVKVLVKAGQTVAADQGIVVLEAMKMENELRTPVAGEVTRLEVAVGDAVEMGAAVATIEPPKEPAKS